ncbi:hypothetical protein ISN44_As03g037470 [Arabidopsis suecica]|uniref:Uncharacterized protein n=1 Tax=Arabidopsis suecica TaxID=45249 RepID=A0A8T2FAY4_ARASU|nr:hypothetical protein ISN44_As03g037470 [Arabidopsis suecica]
MRKIIRCVYKEYVIDNFEFLPWTAHPRTSSEWLLELRV